MADYHTGNVCKHVMRSITTFKRLYSRLSCPSLINIYCFYTKNTEFFEVYAIFSLFFFKSICTYFQVILSYILSFNPRYIYKLYTKVLTSNLIIMLFWSYCKNKGLCWSLASVVRLFSNCFGGRWC
jgi:hypothetical protein